MAKILALGILLGTVIPLMVAAPRAYAHTCTQSVEVEVGETFAVNIGAAAEDKPVTEVQIQVPKGFTLEDNFGFLGWVGERRSGYVAFTQGVIEPYQCAYFTLKGVIRKKGTYVAEITTIASDGTRTVYASRNPYSPAPAMSMYAGVPMPSPEAFVDGGGDSDNSALLNALAVAVTLGPIAVVIGVRLNARRGDS